MAPSSSLTTHKFLPEPARPRPKSLVSSQTSELYSPLFPLYPAVTPGYFQGFPYSSGFTLGYTHGLTDTLPCGFLTPAVGQRPGPHKHGSCLSPQCQSLSHASPWKRPSCIQLAHLPLPFTLQLSPTGSQERTISRLSSAPLHLWTGPSHPPAPRPLWPAPPACWNPCGRHCRWWGPQPPPRHPMRTLAWAHFLAGIISWLLGELVGLGGSVVRPLKTGQFFFSITLSLASPLLLPPFLPIISHHPFQPA